MTKSKIRVISVPDQDKEATSTCMGCKAVLAVPESACSEVKHDRDGSYRNAQCPLCSKTLFISTKAFKSPETV